MRVLEINSVCGYGSTGKIVCAIRDLLLDQGHSCKIAYGRFAAPDCTHGIRIGTTLDVYKHVLLTRLSDRHGFGSRHATKDLIKQVEAYNPDLIHLHNLHGYYVNLPLLFAYLKAAAKPVVWTLHDCWSFTGHCAHYDAIGCDRWQIGCYQCPQKRAYPGSFLLDCSKNNYHDKKALFTGLNNLTIVTPSEWLAKQVSQSFLHEYPVRVMPNGVNCQRFHPVESNFRKTHNLEHTFILLAVASVWYQTKGLGMLVKLAGHLSPDMTLVVIGLNDKQKKLFPDSTVMLPRTHAAEDLAALYTMADVLINLSLEDTFPTTNLEALACGTPVLTFATGGSPESLDAQTGMVVPKGDLNAVMRVLNMLRSKQVILRSEDCQARVRQYFDERNTLSAVSELYRSCLAAGSYG